MVTYSSLKWYDRNGDPITIEEYGRLHQDHAYVVVKQETLPNGLWVSTVWLGLDHNHIPPPLIFETVVFPPRWPSKEMKQLSSLADPGATDEWTELACQRYSTLQAARDGHAAVAEHWAKLGVDKQSHQDV